MKWYVRVPLMYAVSVTIIFFLSGGLEDVSKIVYALFIAFFLLGFMLIGEKAFKEDQKKKS